MNRDCCLIALLVVFAILLIYQCYNKDTFQSGNTAAGWARALGIGGVGADSSLVAQAAKYAAMTKDGTFGPKPAPPSTTVPLKSLSDKENWGRCVNLYARTCDPSQHWGTKDRHFDFYQPLMKNDDGTYDDFCTRNYWTNNSRRDDFNQQYYGNKVITDKDGNLIQPSGTLYQKYCAAPPPSDWTNPWQSSCNQYCSTDQLRAQNKRACDTYCTGAHQLTQDEQLDQMMKEYGIKNKSGGSWMGPGAAAENAIEDQVRHLKKGETMPIKYLCDNYTCVPVTWDDTSYTMATDKATCDKECVPYIGPGIVPASKPKIIVPPQPGTSGSASTLYMDPVKPILADNGHIDLGF